MPTPALRALLVDDDPVILAVLEVFLQGRGYAVRSARDGIEALERLAAEPFDLVVTDRNMPRLDGIALCRSIRERSWPGYLYCIMLTSDSDEEALVTAMEAGVDDFLSKPLRPAELGARLHAAERVLALQAGLAERNRHLADAYGQLSRELELARALQVSMLPAPAEFGRWRFDWVFEASSFVGGDTFDFVPLGDGHACFYLLDVSGHGVSAAMIAFNAQHQLQALLQQVAAGALRTGGSLESVAAAVASAANERFLEMDQPTLYLTMAFGITEAATGDVVLVQAGHPAPLVGAAGAGGFRALGEGGLPIGILPGASWEPQRVRLAPGARLALYSDGVTECRNAAGESFGVERLAGVLRQHQGEPPARACAAVREALRGWRGSAAHEDDVTLLMVEAR